jgi:hypothetical protein
VLSGELARVQNRHVDLALEDPDLDTPAGKYRVNRVVGAVHSDQRPLGDPCDPPAIGLGPRLSITSIKDDPANPRLAAERQERLARLGTPGDRRLAIPDQLLRQYPTPRDIAGQASENVRRLLAEHQAASERPSPTQP